MKKYLSIPGGNPTLLIENLDGKIPRSEYVSLAKKELSKDVEQVGFIEKGEKEDYRLHMMGGEFCVNATRSLAYWISKRSPQRNIRLECSGTSFPVDCEAETWIKIRILKQYEMKQLRKNLSLMKLPGIAHFVIRSAWKGETAGRTLLFKLLSCYEKEIGNREAVGLITLDRNFCLFPLVFVRTTDSCVFETACGSGTLAAYVVLKGQQSVFYQPSGYPFIIGESPDSFWLKSEVFEAKTVYS